MARAVDIVRLGEVFCVVTAEQPAPGLLIQTGEPFVIQWLFFRFNVPREVPRFTTVTQLAPAEQSTVLL